MNKYKYKKPIYAIREDSDESNSNNSENGKTKQLWCICRSEDGARFMICCDSCEEWYHGDCVNITPKQSELISKYFCAQCQKRNPSLKIEYKPGIVIKRPKELQQPSKVDKAFKSKSDDKINENSQLRFDKLHKVKIEEKLMDPYQSKLYKSKTEDKIFDINQSKFDKFSKHKHEEKFEINHSKYEKSHKIKSEERLMDISMPKEPISNSKFDKLIKIKSEEKITESVIKFSQKPVKPGSCGECIGCLRKFDCNVCQNCKTKSDKGCLKRVCQLTTSNTEKIIKAEKLMLTKLPGEFIPTKSAPPQKKQTLIRDLPFSKTNLPSSSSPSSNENHHKAQKRPLSPSTSSESNSIISVKQKISHMNSSNFNKLPPKRMKLDSELNFQKSTKKYIESSESSEDNHNENEGVEDEDMEDESGESENSDDENEDTSGSFVLRKNTKATSKIAPSSIKKKITQPNFIDKNEMMSDSPYVKQKFPRKPAQSKVPDNIKQYKPTQCHNVGCTRLNRLGSKYCSDECGIKLAEQRLLKYLPGRITNWNNTVSICNLKDRRTQGAIQEECETIQYNLNILDKSHHDLIEFIDRWRSSCSASSNTDDDDRRISGVNDDSVQCVTCGYMIGSTKALAHMENCYQKIEGGTMVFADFEEQPIGSKLFCDFYDNNIRGYCKRLAALCDHNKDAKVDPKTICAFPLSVNEKSDKVCMTAKIKCNRHVNWERIQRAVIDMNRYRLLVRYEELQVEDRKFKHNVAQRGGVMSLLLHETIDHQPLKPLVPNRNKERNNKMKKFTKAMCI